VLTREHYFEKFDDVAFSVGAITDRPQLTNPGVEKTKTATLVIAGPQPAQHSWEGGAKKISGGAKHLSSFLKFEVKNRHKSAEEANI